MNFLDSISHRINQRLLSFENAAGSFLASLLLGLLLLGVLMVYVTPVFEPAFNGPYYVQLSQDPFAFADNNPFQYRILPFVIAYFTGLRGELFVLFPLICTWIFLTVLYHCFRKANCRPVDALLITCMTAFSCTVFIQLVSPAYTDTFIYLLVFLSFAFARRPWISALSFCLALLSHECVLFLLPGLILYGRAMHGAKSKQTYLHILLLVLAIVPFVAMRYYISQFSDVKYDFSHYLSLKHMRDNMYLVLNMAPAGTFYAFRLFWFFPLWLIALLVWQKELPLLLTLLALLAGAFAQLIISYDITRHVSLAFPAILIAAIEIKKRWNPDRFTRTALLLFGFNLLIVPYYASPDGLHGLFPLPYTAMMKVFGL